MTTKISTNDVLSIKREQYFGDYKVKKIGNGVFKIIGFWYGEEQEKLTGDAKEVAKWLNGYYGNIF